MIEANRTKHPVFGLELNFVLPRLCFSGLVAAAIQDSGSGAPTASYLKVVASCNLYHRNIMTWTRLIVGERMIVTTSPQTQHEREIALEMMQHFFWPAAGLILKTVLGARPNAVKCPY